MVAVDQRKHCEECLQLISTPVPDSQLTQFKVDVARELSPYASALLADQEFGIDAIVDQKALQGGCGLMRSSRFIGWSSRWGRYRYRS
jgi:sulfofructosephosphate aldolase